MDSDVPIIGCAVLLCVGLIVGLLLFIMWIGNALSFPATQVRIEQLRQDAAHVDLQASEDVYGQVVETNQTIVANQKWNESWAFGWLIPDEWDDIPLIEVQP